MATSTSPIRELGFCHLPLMRSLTLTLPNIIKLYHDLSDVGMT